MPSGSAEPVPSADNSAPTVDVYGPPASATGGWFDGGGSVGDGGGSAVRRRVVGVGAVDVPCSAPFSLARSAPGIAPEQPPDATGLPGISR